MWLTEQELPGEEAETVASCLRHIDFLGEEIAALDREIARQSLAFRSFQRLLTIHGVDVGTAAAVIAAVGDITRFQSAGQLVAYLALTRRSASPGLSPLAMGTSQSAVTRRPARCWSRPRGSRSEAPDRSGRLGSESVRVAARRSRRSLSHASSSCCAGICLTKDQDYAFARPSLTRQKTRRLELLAGAPPLARRHGGPPSPRRAASARPSASCKPRPSSPTGASSTIGARRHRRVVRVRHRGAHLKSPKRAKPRGRPQAPDACASLRQSPAPPQIIPLRSTRRHPRRRGSPCTGTRPSARQTAKYRPYARPSGRCAIKRRLERGPAPQKSRRKARATLDFHP